MEKLLLLLLSVYVLHSMGTSGFKCGLQASLHGERMSYKEEEF